MAGKHFTSSFEDSANYNSGALYFTFSDGSKSNELPNPAYPYPGTVFIPLTGNIEFIGSKKRTHYWKSVVSLCSICAIFSFGFYYLLKDYKTEMATFISVDMPINNVEPQKILDKPYLIAGQSILPAKINKAAIPKPIEQPITPVEKIKPEEKTKIETTAYIISPKPKTTPERIIARPLTPKVENFKTNSLETAKRFASTTGRYVFLKFGAEWCISCKLMEENALRNQRVVGLLDSKFVMVDVDVDELSGYLIKEEFYVEKLPTLIILNELGKQVSRHEGALGTSSLIEMLSGVSPHIYLNEERVTTQVKGENFIQSK